MKRFERMKEMNLGIHRIHGILALVCLGILLGGAAVAATGTSGEFRLDLSDTGTRVAKATESIAYDAAWGGASSGSLKVNGSAMSGLSSMGTYSWTPNTSQTNYWKLTYTAGTVNYSATFKHLGYYAITYANTKGAANSNPSQYNYDSNITFVALPNVTGYVFNGWSPVTIPAGSFGAKTVTAQWTPISYTVKFNKNGGTGTMANLAMTYGTAKALTANAFTRTGYTFKGWATSSGATTAAYTDKQSVSNLTATANGTVNLYAVWQVNTYSIKFNKNGGSGTMANEPFTYGTAKALTANGFTRTGYAFVGWMTSANGTSIAYTDGQSVLNLTNQANATVNLYAKWTDKWYVNAANGNDANQGDSASRAFKTIQRALDKAVAGMTIIVADGTYAPIRKVNLAITIQSVNGASKTIIDGGYPTATNRCVYVGGSLAQTNTVIRGFTIQNGYGDPDGAGVAGGTLYDCVIRYNHGRNGGGAVYSVLYNCIISDNDALQYGGGVCKGNMYGCIVTNNVAHSYGGGVYGGMAEKCAIVDNQTDTLGGGAHSATIYDSEIRCNKSTQNGAGAYSCNLYNCILAENESSSSSGGAHRCQLENCLVYGNRAKLKGGGIVNSTARNCTIYGNTCGVNGGGAYADLENGLSYGTNYNCIAFGNTSAADPEIHSRIPSFNCCTNDPHFIRADAGDFRLRHDSPCINAGNNAYVTNTVDFAGNPRIVGGTVDIGAYEFSEANDPSFTIQVANGTGSGTYYEGDSVTIVAADRLPQYGFTHWSGDVSCISDANSMTNSFTMPAQNLSFTAEYEYFGEPFADGDVTVSGYSGKYDGAAHGITVQSSISGFTVKYCASQNGTYTATSPARTDVGSTTVWCEISAPGYITQTNSATVTVSKRSLTLTSGSASKVYDGTALVKHSVAVSGDGFVSGEGATYSYIGAQTAVGSSANGFIYTLNSNTKAGNYTIATENGTLTVSKAANSWTTQPSIAGWTYGQAANAPNLGAAKFGNVQVSYSATPQNAGSYTATFTVPGTSNYSALSKSVPFVIAKATYDMSGARWSTGSFTYDGTQKSVIVEGLPSGVTVQSYANNAKTAAGNYTATVALNYDTTNFNAPSMPPCNWSIARKNIAGATVALGPTLVYNGAEQTQTVTGVVIDGLNATYSVSGNKGTEVGAYTLTVTGTGNFTGTATKQWQIRPDGIVESVTSYDGIYDGEGHGIVVSVTKPDGALVRYALDASGPYAEDAILFTNVTEGVFAVWYTVEAENYTTVTNFGTVKISPKTLMETMVTVEDVAYTYDGTAKTPTVTVVDGEPSILAEDDYEVAYSDNINAGADTATITVTGKGNYTGTVTKHFTIAKAEVTPPTVASKTYTGGLLKADISSTVRYIAANDGGVNVGSYPVVLTLSDAANYRWKDGDSNPLSLTFSITKATNSWLTQPSIAGWTYGQAANAPNLGEAKFGAVSVAYSATPQNAGSYSATFTVPGTANYSALSKSVPFAIAKATYDMSGARWSTGSFTYDGTQKSVIVEGLPSGVAVQAYANNAKTAAGNYTATVALNYDTTNFNTPSMGSYNWSIARKSIAGATVALGPTLVYNGAEQTQTVTGVKIDGLNATYSVSGNKGTEVGAYTLTVTGTGNFTGTATKQWQIRPDGIVESVTSYDGIYDGEGHGIVVSVTKPDGALIRYALDANGPYAEDAILFTNVTEGVVSVWYMVEAENYTTVTNFGTVKISQKTLTDAMVSVADVAYTYDGAAKTPTVTVADGEPSIMMEDDYEVAYSDNVAAGTDAATITVTGKGNYTGTVTKFFSIDKAENSWLAQPSIAGWTYGQAANVPNLGEAKFGAASVTYSATPQNAGSYTATFAVPGTANYAGLTKVVPFTIAKATYDMTGARWNYAGEFKYDGGQKTVLVTGLPTGVSVLAYSGNSAVAPGTYTAHATLGYDTVNFNALSIADLSWSIKSSEGSKLEEIFDDLPAEVEPDGEDGWKVTLTNDIDSADLPIEIPDYLGHVTIDLNGHDLVGGNGDGGDGTTPGGDGKPAIVVVPGDGGGDPTRLTIITTGDDSLVKGGDGGSGNPGGNGAPGIEVADDVRTGVKIDIGDGVTVRGGDGGASETGRGGDGGAGIDGDVGTNDGTIIGGDGGDSASGDGGDGGMGVTGDVGRNDGVIAGGKGGVSVSGESGDDGKPVGGTIGGGSGTVVKVNVAVPEVPSAEYTGEAVVPQVPTSALYAVSASGGTRPGSYPVMLTLLDVANYEWIPRDGATVNGALAVVDFVIIDPPPHIETEGDGRSGRENAASVTATYDGRGHGISVVVTYPESGARVRYSRAKAGPFAADKPLFTNVVDGAETWYEVSADGFDPVTNMATVTVSPKVLSSVMVTSRRLVEDDAGNVTAELSLSDVPPCVLTQSDWEYVSWAPRASGGGTATIRGVGNYSGSLVVDVPNELIVVFDAVYGDESGVRTATTQTPGRPYVLPPRAPQYRGYDFLGWFTEREGGEEVTSARTVSLRDPDVVYAHWRIRSFRTEFELNGGTGSFEPLSLDYGSAYPALPVPQKSGYLFDGWWTTSDFQKGTMASEGDIVPNRDTTLYAKWLRRRLWYSDSVFHLEAAATWDGYLIDTANGDAVVGTIMVKVGKPNKRTGISKVTATVQMSGARKVMVKGETFDGTLSAKARDGRPLDLKLGASSMTGWFDGYEIDGALNVFTARDAASKMRAAQELKLRQGVYMLVWDDAGWTGLSLTVAAKGKVKVAGALADGTRVMAKSQLLVGERECAVAVSWTKKSSSVSFLMWFCEDGMVECANLPGGLAAMAANAREGAYLVDGAAFRIDAAAIAAAIPGAETELLPDGLPVRMKGTKFDIDRAGRVSLLRDKSGFDLSKAGANPSGLKLTYSIKNCTFKGGFTVYANVAGRLKKVKVTVSGVVLVRKGYGTATVKKIGSWPVVIE